MSYSYGRPPYRINYKLSRKFYFRAVKRHLFRRFPTLLSKLSQTKHARSLNPPFNKHLGALKAPKKQKPNSRHLTNLRRSKFLTALRSPTQIVPLNLAATITKPLNLNPTVANYFIRSPFFFLQLTNVSPRGILDRLRPRQKLTRHPIYSVFPSANAIKVFIFRRFNKQKTKAARRTSFFNNVTRHLPSNRHRLKNRPIQHSESHFTQQFQQLPIFNAGAR